ncbi:MAG: NADH-quinone oxidoreductase subunit J [Anaerolineae bacterium]
MNPFVVLSFVVVAAVTLGGALGVVLARTVFASGLFLILSFLGVAGIYVLLEAPFLAATQVLIYVGAVAVLILFAIMLTRRVMSGRTQDNRMNNQWVAAAAVAVLLFLLLVSTTFQQWNLSQESPPVDSVAALGAAFLGPYILPFEIVSVLLLAALIGSIVIARE